MDDSIRQDFLIKILDFLTECNNEVSSKGESTLIYELAKTVYENIEFTNE